MDDQSAEPGDGGLIDVSGLSLRDLKDVDDSSLAQALLRLTDQQDAETISGFQSRI